MNPIQNPQTRTPRKNVTPILRSDIERAQAQTNSNAAAARFLGVSYKRYKQYAELYGLFAGHLNIAGKGVEKGFSKRPTSIPLRDILANKHPRYSLSKLKNRLLARGKLREHCALCGFDEQRVTDKKVPLMLSFKDGDRTNMALENLQLLCYNCMFLTTGAPSVVYRDGMHKSLAGHTNVYTEQPRSSADGYERDPALLDEDVPQGLLSDEERAQLLDELRRDTDL